jgi:hypothetical protein
MRVDHPREGKQALFAPDSTAPSRYPRDDKTSPETDEPPQLASTAPTAPRREFAADYEVLVTLAADPVRVNRHSTSL